ncbi:MAG: thiamine pyrophosphate-binding protein [Candidatus Jordarchaeum sp.]|uniref:thiamine pyrophosphate-binding protein n=1 Tax=Candidatus Jordarchaeum sp. TaxID=2823881 RepID=UPI00404B1AA9
MVQLNMGKAIVEMLKRNNVEHVFGLVGTAVSRLVYELGKDESIDYIVTRHEQTAASMADGYARVTGKVGVCQATAGPGTLNTVLSVADAYKDGTPMILITGQVRSDFIGRDVFDEVDQIAVFKPITKWQQRIMKIEDVPRIISNAFYLAKSGKPGPVFLEVPEDLWDNVGEANLDYLIRASQSYVASSMIEEAVDLLLKADSPLILAGAGVMWSEAWEELRALAETLEIPVATTGNGRGVIPEDHPLSVGMAGSYGGNAAADYALASADLVLAIGASVSVNTMYFMNNSITGELIHVNIDPTVIGKNYPCRLGIVGDAKLVLSEMLRILKSKTYTKKTASWISELENKRREWVEKWYTQIKSDAVPIKPQRLLTDMRKIIPRNAIITMGAGSHHAFAAEYFPVYHPRSQLSAFNFAAMAFAFPAALGAKVAKPDTPVICIIGEGDFMMTIQDLETAVREEINVVSVILNNGCYGTPKLFQKTVYGDAYGCDYGNPSLAKLAEDFGACGWTLERPSEIQDTIKEALDCGKPAVVDVPVDPDELIPINLEAYLGLTKVSPQRRIG